jgi:hypothetical protein
MEVVIMKGSGFYQLQMAGLTFSFQEILLLAEVTMGDG